MSRDGRLSLVRHIVAELSRRRVFRMAALYAVVGWLITEIAATVLPALRLPDWSVTLVLMLIVFGFPVALVLSWALDVGPDGIRRTPSTTAAPATGLNTSTSPDAETTVQATPHTDLRRSIAVLPFANTGGDPEDEYFADGVSEEIRHRLSLVPRMRVASRSSSFYYKNVQCDIPTVAERLGVSTILAGSIRRSGPQLRITTDLVDTASDTTLWSETYDRQLTDILDVQDDIAQSIVDALRLKLTARDRQALEHRGTSNPRAYDLYLQGRKYFYMMSMRGFRYALQTYSKAIELDPAYALAWSGTADSYSFLHMYGESTAANLQKADEASRMATELAPDLAEAHVSRGIALSIADCRDDADSEFEQAILHNPRLFEAYYLYGRMSLAHGQSARAARLFLEATKVDPCDYQSAHFLGVAYDQLASHKDADSAHGRAVEILVRHLEICPDDVRALCLGAASLAHLGRNDAAVEWATRAADTGLNEPTVLYNLACVHTKLGQIERALEMLRRATRGGFTYRSWLDNDPDLAPLRGTADFARILNDMPRR